MYHNMILTDASGRDYLLSYNGDEYEVYVYDDMSLATTIDVKYLCEYIKDGGWKVRKRPENDQGETKRTTKA
mgnify:CR=1 FL=1